MGNYDIEKNKRRGKIVVKDLSFLSWIFKVSLLGKMMLRVVRICEYFSTKEFSVK